MIKTNLTNKHLKYATHGLHFRERTIEMLSAVLVEGKEVIEVADTFSVSRQHIHRAIKQLTTNLRKRMEEDGMTFVLALVPKDSEETIRSIECEDL